MTDRLIRLMRIITLIQAKPGILARELAERCGNSERTIYRDMDALSAMHIPITHLGHGKGYAFIGNFALYPLDLSEEEAYAFSQLSSIMKNIRPMLPPQFEAAFEKMLAAQYKQRVEKEEKMERARNEDGQQRTERGAAQGEHVPHMSVILNAVMKQKGIQANYVENGNEEKDILIDPYCLVPLENRYHLVGYCHKIRMTRTFHVTGFSDVRQLPHSFSREKFNLQSFMEQKWSLDQDSLQIDFKVRFSERVLKAMKQEEFWIRPFKMDYVNRSVEFKVAVQQDIGFVQWIMSFEEDAELLEPLHYRDALRYRLENWLYLYK